MSSSYTLPLVQDPRAFAPLEAPQPMIQVLGYTPREGEEGVPISIRIHFHTDSIEPIHVRLVVGNKAISTTVRELEGEEYGRWQLDAAAPALNDLPATARVPVTVQALNEENTVLDSVDAGDFLYWLPGECRSPHPKPSPDIKNPTIPRRNRAATHLPTPNPKLEMPSPSLSERVPRSKTRQRKRESSQSQKCIKAQSLMRARQHAPGEVADNLYAHTPVLELVTPLESLCVGWDAAEVQAGRRLVRFHKIQDGCRVILSCEAIKQHEYDEADSVVSCIYRAEAEGCVVTSVDIICLLERLTNDSFPVEEKNRIRRNLEGLRPTTVSKHKSTSGSFFQRIMDFPDPRPRNIEKDLKVFEWTQLGQALEKIMSKYSIYTSSPTDSEASLPTDSSHVDPSLVTKEGPLPESILFMSSEDYEAQHSPLSPTVPLFTTYGSDTSNRHESDSSSESWASENNCFPSKDDILPPFDAILPVHEYEEPNPQDFHVYDPLGYNHHLQDEGMIDSSF